MEWGYTIIAGLFILGVLLAFPLAIGICVALGGELLALDRLTTRCPRCGKRRMRLINGIRGKGWFYRCLACEGRWFWSGYRAWREASSPHFDWLFVEGQVGRTEPGAVDGAVKAEANE